MPDGRVLLILGGKKKDDDFGRLAPLVRARRPGSCPRIGAAQDEIAAALARVVPVVPCGNARRRRSRRPRLRDRGRRRAAEPRVRVVRPVPQLRAPRRGVRATRAGASRAGTALPPVVVNILDAKIGALRRHRRRRHEPARRAARARRPDRQRLRPPRERDDAPSAERRESACSSATTRGTSARPDAVVHTAAVRPDNPEIVAASAAGIPLVRRADLLGALMRQEARRRSLRRARKNDDDRDDRRDPRATRDSIRP